MLNIFWGKFGEQLNKCQAETVTSPARLYQLLRDTLVDIHDIRIVNPDCLEVVYSQIEDNAPVSGRTNVLIAAAFTTCLARLLF